MLYTAGAILIAAAILVSGFSISFTLARGFTRMSDALTSATAALDAAVAKVVTDVSAGLTAIANGTATTAILAEVDKLNALDTSVLAAEAPPATVAGGTGDDSVTGSNAGDTVVGGNGDDTVGG